MIFLQKEDDAVFQLNAHGLLRLELVQPGKGNLFPRLGRLGRLGLLG